MFALKDVDRNREKVYSIKLMIKTNKLAEKVSKNMIYISSCINLPNVLAMHHHTSPLNGIIDAASKLIFLN